jgi:hypothetical protein
MTPATSRSEAFLEELLDGGENVDRLRLLGEADHVVLGYQRAEGRRRTVAIEVVLVAGPDE